MINFSILRVPLHFIQHLSIKKGFHLLNILQPSGTCKSLTIKLCNYVKGCMKYSLILVIKDFCSL